MNHEDRVVNITKLTIEQLQPEITKQIQQLEKLKEGAVVVTAIDDQQTKPKTVKKKDELPWRITPMPGTNNLIGHYMMLSKIRLTCKSEAFFSLPKDCAKLNFFTFQLWS